MLLKFVIYKCHILHFSKIGALTLQQIKKANYSLLFMINMIHCDMSSGHITINSKYILNNIGFVKLYRLSYIYIYIFKTGD